MRNTAQQLLHRTLLPSDGIEPALLDACEKRLGCMLPEALRELYLLVGNVPMLVSSFQRFLSCDALHVKDEKLVFAEENQMESQEVHQESNGRWYSENADLASFITILLYYNCAQGGYDFCGIRHDPHPGTWRLPFPGWLKVIDHNRLVIYSREDNLIWHFCDEKNAPMGHVYLSSRRRAIFKKLCAEYGFVVL